jgi:hypothetical protein
MSSSRISLRVVAVVVALGGLAAGGCKQGLGERCEIDSDCASGICGPHGMPDTMTSASGLQCVASIAFETGTNDASAAEAGRCETDAALFSTDASANACTDAGPTPTEDAALEAAADVGSPDVHAAVDGSGDVAGDSAVDEGVDGAPEAGD